MSLKCFWLKQHLLVLLEKVRRFKQFGPFCFSLKNLVCDAEACPCNTHHKISMQIAISSDSKKDTLYNLKKPKPKKL